MLIYLDFESRSKVDLSSVGVYNYCTHPSTEILMLGWAVDDQPVEIWEPHKTSFPEELNELLKRSEAVLLSWNVPFEHGIFLHKLRKNLSFSRWKDIMVQARYLSLPGSLEDCGKVLGLSEDEGKIKDGKRLLELFSEPSINAGKITLFGPEPDFNDWNSHPADWAKLLEYCKRDVTSERTLYNKMKGMDLPVSEWRAWRLDQEINSVGVPINTEFAAKLAKISDRAMKEGMETLALKTGLANPNSNPQMLEWVRKQGYPYGSLNKKDVTLALSGKELNPLGREVLELRKKIAKISVKKLNLLPNLVSEDGMLRNQFMFMGAARTARWCIAEGSLIRVKCINGVVSEKPIQNVTTDDLVWDGENWVCHDGVVFSGEKDTVYWDGVEASPEHEVWVSNTEKTALYVAQRTQTGLWKGLETPYKIYKLTSPSGRFYIGLTKQSLRNRWLCHVKRAKNSAYNHPLYNSIRKYGADSFLVEILDIAKNEKEAKYLEIQYIAESPKKSLYNISEGGESDGGAGRRLFWERLNANPEARKEYLTKLSSVKLENDWSDYKAMSLKQAEWVKNNRREAWKMAYRASRIAKRTTRKHEPSMDTRSLKEKLMWKYKVGTKRRENTTRIWSERTQEEKDAIFRKISDTLKKKNSLLSEDEKREMTAKARGARLSKYENL